MSNTQKKASAKKLTTYTTEFLIGIHNEKANGHYSWASMIACKERLAQNRSSLMAICATYNVPCRMLSSRSQIIVSLPALDWVLTNTPELVFDLQADTNEKTMARIKGEAENEAKVEYKKAMLAKIEALKSEL